VSLRAVALAAAALLLCGFLSPPATWTEWNSDRDGSPKTYESGGFVVTVATDAADEDPLPVLTISYGNGRPLELRGQAAAGAESASAELMVASLDRQASRPQVLVRTFSHGAHCCLAYQLVERRGSAWVEHQLGTFDLAAALEPVDIDQDGKLEFAAHDQAFLLAFGGAVERPMPPQVFEVVGGRLVDVSGEPRYRSVYEASLANDRETCRHTRHPAACLVYAATLARLGRLDEAWPLVESADLTLLPHRDRGQSFRRTIETFLAERGYVLRDHGT